VSCVRAVASGYHTSSDAGGGAAHGQAAGEAFMSQTSRHASCVEY
jgi:hypothetical protein